MNRLIINYENISIEDAISYTESVIHNGKISNNNTQYCYATRFKNNVMVYAYVTKTGNYAFRVYKHEQIYRL